MAGDETEGAPDPDDFTDDSPCPGRDAELAAICNALHELGVTSALARYEGCGDEGSAGDVEYEPADARVSRVVEDRLRDVAECYCPDGYENNDGGYGSLTVYPALGLAGREHRDWYQDAEDMGAGPVALPAALRDRLAQLGVTAVTARFDGYGDSGQVEDLATEPASVVLDNELANELEEFLLGLLPGGWEIGGGGFGDFRVDVAGDRADVEASWRVAMESGPRVTRWKWGA